MMNNAKDIATGLADWFRAAPARLFRRPFTVQRIFLLIAAPLSIVLVFLIPPFQAPDEHTHFYKEVYESRGHLIAHILPPPNRVGAELPTKYAATANHYTYMFLDHTKKLDLSILKQDLKHPLPSNVPKPTHFENTAQYPPLAYAPQSLAIFITHGFTGSVLLQLYAARLATAITWLALIFFSIRMLPFAKWGMLALSITPLSLFLSASCSNDAITFGLSALFVALVLKIAASQRAITARTLTGLTLSGLALGLCKPPYFILTGLALGIPLKRFRSRQHYLKSLAVLFGVTLVAALIWEYLARHLILNFYPGSDTSGQVHYVAHHAYKSTLMILKTLTIYPIGDDLTLQITGLRAWMDIQTPFWLIDLNYILIFTALLYEPIQKKTIQISLRLIRLLAIGLGVGGILLVSLLIYLTYTPVGISSIVGLQGRYFIPFSYLLIPALANLKSIKLTLQGRSILTFQILLVGVALSVLPLTISRYY